MSKSDLQARPIYHRKRDSIEAHLTIVFAALAVSHWVETTTARSIRNFVRTARRYRTITIQAGSHTITAANLVPDDLQGALTSTTEVPRGFRTVHPLGWTSWKGKVIASTEEELLTGIQRRSREDGDRDVASDCQSGEGARYQRRYSG